MNIYSEINTPLFSKNIYPICVKHSRIYGYLFFWYEVRKNRIFALKCFYVDQRRNQPYLLTNYGKKNLCACVLNTVEKARNRGTKTVEIVIKQKIKTLSVATVSSNYNK